MPVSGEVPVHKVGPVTTVISEDFVYVYGGTERNDGNGGEGFDIYEFATSSGVFRHLPVTGIRPRPRHSLRGWSHENKLYFFAGCLRFGDDKNGNYLVAPEERNMGTIDNLLAEFDLGTNEWRSVDTKGPRPSPRHGYAAAKSGDHVFIHGGFGVVKHEFHVLDMTTKTWTEIVNDVPSSFRWRRQFHHTLTAATEKRLYLVGVGGYRERENEQGQYKRETIYVSPFNLEDFSWMEEYSFPLTWNTDDSFEGLPQTIVIEKQDGVSLVTFGLFNHKSPISIVNIDQRTIAVDHIP